MDATRRKFVQCPDTPKPRGPYSHAVVVDNMAYIAGLIGTVPASNKLISDDAGEQTTQALANLGTVLNTIGADYKSDFSDHHPARTLYSVKELPKRAKVEIESMALVGEIKDV